LSWTSTEAAAPESTSGGAAGLERAAQPESEYRRPLLFPRTNYVWPYASGPVYDTVDAVRWKESGVLHTRVGSFDLKRGGPAIPEELRATVKAGLPQYFIIQVDPASFADGRFDHVRSLIEDQGGALLEGMSVGGYITRLTPGVQGVLKSQPGVVAVEPYHPAFKLAPTIGRVPLPDPARAVSEVYALEALLHPGENAELTARALADMGANVTKVDPDVVYFEIHRSKLGQVAGLEPVKAVFESLPNLAFGEETTIAVQTGKYGGGVIPYHDAGVRGDGGGIVGASAQILMVLDTGIQLDAGDLSDTRVNAGTAGAGHRKVRLYTTAVGGSGDFLGCDAGPQGGFTHGQTVSATALGNATAVPGSYGAGWLVTDTRDNQWKVDGVAPRALLLAYDAHVTPGTLSCGDPTISGLAVGNIYSDNTPGSGSLGDGYTRGARVFNFSWGSTNNNTYATNATRTDAFLFDHLDAMVFVAAGNDGTDDAQDLEPDPLSISDPATCKSCIVVGASGNVDDPDDGSNEQDRAGFSSVGPTAVTGRINPVLMAPGTDFGAAGANMGVDSEYSCRTNDNNQTNPVECDLVDSIVGTSFSAPAAAGSALLVRDWFAQGFYPDGTSSNPANAGDQVANISGALLKAVLVTSADWLEGGEAVGGNTFQAFRFNREQGYGRITLSNALPLSTYSDSPTGMILSDGGLLAGGRVDISGIPGSSPAAGTTQSGTVRINSNQKELRCALAWVEDAGDALAHDLDLEMVSPSGKVYFGNFFTEDVDRDGIHDAGENCLDRGPVPNTVDEGIWSIETNACGAIAGSRRDEDNPVEGIFLSPDYLDNGVADDPDTAGINEGTDNQIEPGDWTLRVIYRTGAGSQRYAVSCSGPVASGSSVRLDQGEYVCSDGAKVTVNESTDALDAAPSAAEVGSRTTVQVIDVGVNGVYENGGGDDIVRDSETGAAVLAFTAIGQRYESTELTLTDGTAYDPGNGALDVRHGNRIKVIYADESGGAPDANKLRFNSATVNCQTRVFIGGVVWATFGRDLATLINGGCERDARSLFTFGFPDKYMDAGELINYRIDFQSLEATEDLIDASVTLRCVKADADSPADCLPGGGGDTACADPNRTNNPACTEMTVLDSPIIISKIPAGEDVSANFNISMAGAITGTPKVDMLLGVTAKKAGKSVESLIVSRHVLDVDEASVFYSTDFPTGGNETRDYNENETVQVVTTNTGNFDRDYLFETRTYGDLTAGGTKNTGLNAPWNFDANNGAFRVGLNPESTDLGVQVVANWGEDKNFNNLLDPGEDREPAPFGSGGTLDASWNTRGGCGWQTRGANPTGGIWHTGGIDLTSLACGAQCELVDTVVGTNGVLGQWEMLITPVVQKVNSGLDGEGDPTHQVQFTNWAWNMEMDLATEFDILLWELDTDTQSITRADLFNDQTILNFIGGAQGALAGGNSPLTGGFQVFAPFSGTTSVNGTAGNNRVGKNACIFEVAGTANRQADSTLGFAKPEDRSDGISDETNPGQGDFDDDGDTLIDEFVTANGPIRNFDIVQVNGPDLRFATLEDIYGEAGNSFQGSLGFWAQEGLTGGNQPVAAYGVGVDDMVLEWREYSLAKDSTSCATGVCATLTVSVTNMFEGSGVVTVTVLDASPGAPGTQVNDCNFNGVLDAGDDTDCDNNGTQDVVVKAFSDAEIAGELLILNRVGVSSRWTGEITFSSAINVPNVLYIVRSGVDAPSVNVRYYDANDGTGAVCANDADVTRRGTIDTGTTVTVDSARIIVKGARIANTGGAGDSDGFADTNETVQMFLTLSNRSGAPRTGIVARVSSNDPKIDCILDPVIVFGNLADKQTLEQGSDFFLFKVKDGVLDAGETAAEVVNRTDPNADLFATFSVTVSGDDFDTVTRSQEVVIDLDLNVTGGLLPTNYTESFEGAGFGSFTSQSLDAGKESLAASNGMRCQYNDPDFVNSNSYGNSFCYVGAFPAAQNAYDWHVHTTASPDGGRAYLGNNSLHWGRHPGASSADTTSLKQLDAIRTTNPVNLGWNNVVSDLSFKHEVGLSDCDYVNCPDGFTADRGIVQVQLANSAGTAIGNWRKIQPYENLYDSQTVDNYINCLFDPTDDGTTEDDYFDPEDPNRRLGPSSSCNPEFNFSRHGAIAFDSVFNVNALGHASDGPGLRGVRGPGTWIQTKFSLDRYRGRRIRIRFLATSIEVSDAITMQQALDWNPTEADDGWYIDDIQVSNTLTSAATLTADTAANAGLPASCSGAACTSVTAALAPDPSTTEAPGQLTTIDASGSAGGCRDGVLQYRFWTTNNNTTVGDAGDVLLRTWTDNPELADAPNATTRYGVQVRCSALVSCQSSATTTVTVNCPTTGNAVAPFAQSIGFSNKTTVAWTSSALVDVIRGNLNTLRANGGQFNGTVDACLGNNVTVSSVADATVPALNGVNYYLVRGAGPSAFCNAGNSWKTGVAAEKPGVGGDRDADIVLDASTCP
jgi:hypothetical protein